MFILNWDFDVLPITFNENFMLCSLVKFVCKIPLLARRTRPKGRPSAARDDRYLVYNI